MLDVPMSKVRLEGSRVVASVRQRVAASMPEHMRVRLERQLRHSSCSFNHASEACGREGGSALRREHEGRFRLLLPLEPPESTQFVPEDRMCARGAPLKPADVEGGRPEID